MLGVFVEKRVHAARSAENVSGRGSILRWRTRLTSLTAQRAVRQVSYDSSAQSVPDAAIETRLAPQHIRFTLGDIRAAVHRATGWRRSRSHRHWRPIAAEYGHQCHYHTSSAVTLPLIMPGDADRYHARR
jgi:hypothetical protein